MARPVEIQPLTPIRRVIAARMVEAKQTIPHFRIRSRIRSDQLNVLRHNLLSQTPGAKLSFNDLLIKACALALRESPDLNVQWHEDGIHRFDGADIAIVVALPDGGIVTPVVRDAERKSLWEIASEARELSRRASEKSLKLDEISGGTFSISNLGMYGVEEFDAIINPPQCAILAAGASTPTAEIGEGGAWERRSEFSATLSVDHRAIDGASAANFMKRLKEICEYPNALTQQ